MKSVTLTSKLAHSELPANQKKNQCILVTRLVAMRPGYTSLELSKLGKNPQRLRYILAMRLAQAERRGWVYRSGPRRCRVSGRMAYAWHITHAGSCI